MEPAERKPLISPSSQTMNSGMMQSGEPEPLRRLMKAPRSAEKRYPLPRDEQRALIVNLVLSQTPFLGIGIVGAIALSVWRSGWSHAISEQGWLHDLGASLALEPLPFVAALFVAFALAQASEWMALRSDEGARAGAHPRRSLPRHGKPAHRCAHPHGLRCSGPLFRAI